MTFYVLAVGGLATALALAIAATVNLALVVLVGIITIGLTGCFIYLLWVEGEWRHTLFLWPEGAIAAVVVFASYVIFDMYREGRLEGLDGLFETLGFAG